MHRDALQIFIKLKDAIGAEVTIIWATFAQENDKSKALESYGEGGYTQRE